MSNVTVWVMCINYLTSQAYLLYCTRWIRTYVEVNKFSRVVYSLHSLQFIAQSAVSYIVHVRVKSCDPFTRIARNSVKNWAQNKNSRAI